MPGLCAETVVDGIEDTEDYRDFEAAGPTDFHSSIALQSPCRQQTIVRTQASCVV